MFFSEGDFILRRSRILSTMQALIKNLWLQELREAFLNIDRFYECIANFHILLRKERSRIHGDWTNDESIENWTVRCTNLLSAFIIFLPKPFLSLSENYQLQMAKCFHYFLSYNLRLMQKKIQSQSNLFISHFCVQKIWNL